jgi:hypothetical protein
MDNRTRLTYLTRYYYDLQGVRFAPLWIYGLIAVFLAPVCVNWKPLSTREGVTLLLCLLALEVLWYCLANLYYRRRFGWLKPDPLRIAKKIPREPQFFIVWMLFLSWMIYCRIIHSSAYFPYLLALFLCQPSFDTGNPWMRRIYYCIGSGLIAASALFNWFSHQDGEIYFVTMLIVMLALGFADHLLLLSLISPRRKDADA